MDRLKKEFFDQINNQINCIAEEEEIDKEPLLNLTYNIFAIIDGEGSTPPMYLGEKILGTDDRNRTGNLRKEFLSFYVYGDTGKFETEEEK